MADPIQGYFNSTTFTLDVNGFPIWNRAVGSEFMAKFAHTVLGNGAAAVTTGGFQVVKKTGMIVTIKPYFICKDGYMMYQTAETDIEFTSSTSEQVFYIGARLDVANNHFDGDDVGAYTTFVSATDIASCRLTIPANAVAITDGMIEDLRYSTDYCGQIDAYRERSIALLAELEAALETALAGGIPAHASIHAAGGADAVTPASIGAAAASHTHAKGDVANLGATLLFDGAWGSGNITVTNFDKFNFFVLFNEGSSIPVFAYCNGSYLRGIGGHASANSEAGQQTVFFGATVSGTTLTFVASNYSSSPTTNRPIRAIYGIV